VVGDIDGDGDEDLLLVLFYDQYTTSYNRLYQNEGSSRVAKWTLAVNAGAIVGQALPVASAMWVDYDSDGLLDMVLGCKDGGTRNAANAVFRNNGDGTFSKPVEGVFFQDINRQTLSLCGGRF
jgi:hypothetical protein